MYVYKFTNIHVYNIYIYIFTAIYVYSCKYVRV